MSWSSKYLGEVLKWQVLQKPNQEQQSATHFVKMSFAFPLVNRKAYMDSQGPWTTFPPEWITYTFLIVFLFLVLYRGLHNLSVCVHMLIWLACTSPPPPQTCKQGTTCARYHHLMLLPQELSILFCELASLTGHRDEAGLAGQPTPGLYCFCQKHQHHTPFSFRLLLFCLLVLGMDFKSSCLCSKLFTNQTVSPVPNGQCFSYIILLDYDE